MALRVEWLGIAEGSGNDARGALTLIGVNQNVIQPPSLPQTHRQVFIVHIADDTGDILVDGTTVFVELKVESPSGRTLSSSRSAVNLGQKQYPTIRATHIQVIAETLMRFEEYGTYVIACTIEAPGDRQASAEKKIYVLEPTVSGGDGSTLPSAGQSAVESSA